MAAVAIPAVAAGLFEKALKSMGSELGTAAVKLNQFNQLVGSLGDQIAAIVKTFNPAAFKQFQIAVSDATAAIGKILTPVLQAITPLFKALNAVITNLQPALEAFGPVLQQITTVVRQVMEQVGAMLTRLAPSFVGSILKVVEAFQPLLDHFVAMVPIVLSVLEPLFELGNALREMSASILGALIGALKPLFPVLQAISQVIGVLVELIAGTLGTSFKLIGTLIQVALAPLQLVLTPLAAVLETIAKVVGGLLLPLTTVITEFGAIAAELAELFSDELTAVFAELAELLRGPLIAAADLFVSAMRQIAEWMRHVADLARILFGIERPDTTFDPNRRTQAVREAQIGSVESFLNAARTRAFSIGGTQSPQEKNTSAVNGLTTETKSLKEIIERLTAPVERIANKIDEGGDAAAGTVAGMTMGADWLLRKVQSLGE